MGRTMKRPSTLKPFRVKRGSGGVSKLVRRLLDSWQGEPLLEHVQPLIQYRASFLLDRERTRVLETEDTETGKVVTCPTLREQGYTMEDIAQAINLRIIQSGIQLKTLEQAIILAKRCKPRLRLHRSEVVEPCPLVETQNAGDMLASLIEGCPQWLVPSVVEFVYGVLLGHKSPSVSGQTRRQREQMIERVRSFIGSRLAS